MLPKSLKVLIFMTSLYYYKSLSKAQFTEENLSKFSTEDDEKSSREFYQQELNSNNIIYNKSTSNSIDLSDKHSDDVIVKIISKLREKSISGEIPLGFIDSLMAFFYENHPQQTRETNFFELIKFLTTYSTDLKELKGIPLYSTEKVINVQSFHVILSVLRDLPKYVSKDMIIINQMSIEEFLPLIKEYRLIKNDKNLDDFPSYIFEVNRNMKFENLQDWDQIKNDKLVKRSAVMSDLKREERSLSNTSTLVGTIFSSIRGGGSNLIYWIYQLLNMANIAFEGVTEHNSLVSIKLFPITLREIVSECNSLEEKFKG